MNHIKLIALDMDGTLFNTQSTISEGDKEAVRRAARAGVEIVIATGRQYKGLPIEQLADLGIRYAITVNGAAIYRLPDGECLYEDCMSADFIVPIIKAIQEKDVLLDVFIKGESYTQISKQHVLDKMDIPEALRQSLKSTRVRLEDIADYLSATDSAIQKGVANFYPLPDGSYKDRDALVSLLSGYSQITSVCGGFHNLEFTKVGNSKGAALRRLARLLGISIEETAACGDSENDLDIIQAAGIGIAMANASEDVKNAADFVTLSNDECGVAHAIFRLLK